MCVHNECLLSHTPPKKLVRLRDREKRVTWATPEREEGGEGRGEHRAFPSEKGFEIE